MTQNNDLKEYPAQRDEFEEWARDNGMPCRLAKNQWNEYDNWETEGRWFAWQAAQKQTHDALIKKSKEDGILIKILTGALQGLLHDSDENSYQIAETAIQAAANLRLQESE